MLMREVMKKTCATLSLFWLLTSCAAITLKPGAEKVFMTFKSPAKSCEFIGMVQGSQGNFFTGGWTSNSNLQQGASNDIRNKAFTMGANYVELLTDRASQTGNYDPNFGGSSQQTGVLQSGNAFKCPPSAMPGAVK